MNILEMNQMASLKPLNSSNSTDYKPTTPREAYQAVNLGSHEAIRSMAPHFTYVQVEFIANFLKDPAKVAIVQEAWNRAHPRQPIG